MEKEVDGVLKNDGKYFVVLEDGAKIRVDSKEYQKIKQRLAGKGSYFITVNKESEEVYE